jgi:sugar O-acyltransferase (sialic acid O-acetyltransferase NeuD family)
MTEIKDKRVKELYIVGAGGFGREVADTVRAINERAPAYRIAGFVDDAESLWGGVPNDIPVIGGRACLKKIADTAKPHAVIAIADARIKETIAADLDAFVTWENIVHPAAVVSKYAEIGCGVIVQAHATLSSNTKVGDHTMVNIASALGHDAVLSEFASVMSFCDVTGGVYIGKGAYLATSVAIVPGVRVGEYAYICAGSVVFKDVNPRAVMIGNPAKQVR